MTEDFKMPLGKHKGEYLADIPVGYLDWLIGQEWVREELRREVEAHLQTRPEWHRMEDDE